jgi:transcriptional regulator with XRE-family HTH domain
LNGNERETVTAWVSQDEFADQCVLDRTYLGGIERGERNVALVNIEKIASSLKISCPNYFVVFRCWAWIHYHSTAEKLICIASHDALRFVDLPLAAP